MFLTPDQLPFFGGHFPSARSTACRASRPAVSRAPVLRPESAGDPRERRAGGRRPAAHAAARRRGAPVAVLARAVDAAATTSRRRSTRARRLQRRAQVPASRLDRAAPAPHAASRTRAPSSARSSRCARWRAAASTTRLAEVSRATASTRVGDPALREDAYDNGWLMRLYAEAWCATRDPPSSASASRPPRG